MSDTCSGPGCGGPITGDDIDHTEAPPDQPNSRDANLTPVLRRQLTTSGLPAPIRKRVV